MPPTDSLIMYVLSTLALAFGLWGILFWFYAKEKRARDVGAGLGLSLFLVSIPEARATQGGSAEEQLKNFIAQMEHLLTGLATLKRKGWAAQFWKNPVFTLEIAAHNTGNDIFFYI